MPADSAASSGAPSSTALIACATARRSPANTPVTNASTSMAAQPTPRRVGAPAPRSARAAPGIACSATRSDRQYARSRSTAGSSASVVCDSAAARFTCSRWSRCSSEAARLPARVRISRRAARRRDGRSSTLSSSAEMASPPTSGASDRASQRRSRPRASQIATATKIRSGRPFTAAASTACQEGPHRERAGGEQVQQGRVPQEMAEDGERAQPGAHPQAPAPVGPATGARPT